MTDHWQILHYLPAQTIAGGVVPVLQLAGKNIGKWRLARKSQRLREEIIALNEVITSMRDAPDRSEYHGANLQGALLEREFLLRELAGLESRHDQPHREPLNAARRLFLLYPATRLIGWLLHWGFFTLLIVTVAGVIRGLLHVNYLPDAVLIPFLVTTAALAALVRLTVFFLERQRNFQSPLNRETSTALIWLIAVVFSFHISGLAQQDSRAKSQNRQFTTPTIREQS